MNHAEKHTKPQRIRLDDIPEAISGIRKEVVPHLAKLPSYELEQAMQTYFFKSCLGQKDVFPEAKVSGNSNSDMFNAVSGNIDDQAAVQGIIDTIAEKLDHYALKVVEHNRKVAAGRAY